MSRAGKAALRFVRALLTAGEGWRQGELFTAGEASLEAGQVRKLIADGAIAGDATRCQLLPGTTQWLKRQMLDEDGFAAQHRIEVTGKDGVTLNLAESPLARLATISGEGEAFLKPNQVEAGERIRKLVERTQLQPRLTMSYSPPHRQIRCRSCRRDWRHGR